VKKLPFHIPEPVRLKALSEGPAGEAWLAGLEGVVSELAAEWVLSLGRTLSGGTEAFVAEVATADGRAAILKVSPPWSTTAEGELQTLLVARGRGYAELYRHEQARKALLLERLGPRLDELGLSVEAQLEVICATLRQAWTPLPTGGHFMTGAEKAASLSEFIETTWLKLGRPCSERTIAVALHYAADRRQCFDPDQAVLAHGDAHASNTLLVAGGDPRRFKFVDPDGLFIERAYDLGILMREWTSELLVGDPLDLGERRCRRLAELTGVAPEPIWRWGFIERVSTGLLCLEVGLEEAREMLFVADAWAGSMPLNR
jgi:streptomycin 6-kinase